MKEQFKRLYNEVFDKDGNIKACGRDTCKKLIDTANKIDNKTEYGNSKTGFMNTDNLKVLYSEINC